MSVRFRVSAPGKLVVLGEYAVLFGAPAVVMAINRRAEVALEPASIGDRWVVTAPGLLESQAAFDLSASGAVRWNDAGDGERLVLVTRVIESMTANGLLDPPGASPWRMDLDTTAFFTGAPGERQKLGLGSSAALTVALASALSGRVSSGGAVDLDWLRSLVALHRVVQGGLGSGVDVAASLCGGVTRYQLGSGGEVVEVLPMDWPASISKAFVWTGRSVSTGSFLDRLQASRRDGGAGVDEALDRLGGLSERGVGALEQDDPGCFLDAVDGFCDALDDLGKALSMPILSEAHRRLRQVATKCGVHYKPSGAGGGDFGICFGADRDRVDEFSRRVTAEGFATPGIDLDLTGVAQAGM